MKPHWLTALFIMLSILSYAQKNDSIYRNTIEVYKDQIQNDASIYIHKFSIKRNGQTIQYEYKKYRDQIVEINRSWENLEKDNYKTTTYQSFILQNEKKVYGYESIMYQSTQDTEDTGGWSCSFWIKDDKVVYMTSLGHGKTELDNWNYEKELKHNFKKMMKDVRRHK